MARQLSMKQLTALLGEAEHDVEQHAALLPTAKTVLEANRITCKLNCRKGFVRAIKKQIAALAAPPVVPKP